MGFTRVTIKVENLKEPGRSAEVECLVDTGAIHTMIPRSVLEQVGIQPERQREFTLANGSKITRSMGAAMVRLNGDQTATDVVFGESGDAALLGVVTLESMLLQVDPTSGTLKPLPNYLMSTSPAGTHKI